MSAAIERYLKQLAAQLQREGRFDPVLIEEAREHLLDAERAALADGLAPDQAAQRAIDRFGATQHVVAETLHDVRASLPYFFLGATAAGLLIAFIDSRPGWDDTGVTAGALLLSAALFGAAAPELPWLWALALGIWIPARAAMHAGPLHAASMLLVLAFPLAGAYVGKALRRALA